MAQPTSQVTRWWGALQRALQRAGFAAEDPSAVYSSLVAAGAPLWNWPADAVLPKEAAFAAGAKLARGDSTLLRVLPLVYWLNLEHTDWNRTAELARAFESAAELGMLLDWVAVLRQHPTATWWSSQLEDARPKSPQYFLEPRGEFDRKATVERTPEVARRWNFWLNVGDDSFRSLLEKHGA